MGLDVYFRRDIANALAATAYASEAAAKTAEKEGELDLTAYRQGAFDVLVAMGLAFGLKLTPAERWRESAMWIEMER